LARTLFVVVLVAAGFYFGGRLLVSPGGRYWVAQHLFRGSPGRVGPVVEDVLAEAVHDLNFPPPYPKLRCEPDSARGLTRCSAVIQITPGTSTIQANVAVTTRLLDLGLDLRDGTEAPDRTVVLDFQAGPRALIRLRLLPPAGTGLDTVVAPAPELPPVKVKVRLALIIEEYGTNRELSRRFRELPGQFTAAINPELEGAGDLADQARRAGMEVLLNLPMEPKSFPTRNPGPNAVLVDLSGRAIRKLVRRDLDRLGPVVGIKTRMGSLAVEDRDVMRPILEEAKKRNLIFVDSTQEKFSTAADLGREIDVAVLTILGSGDIERGHTNAGTIQIRFDSFVKDSEKKGYGIARVRLQEGTLDVLERALPVLARRGIVVMGVGEVVRAERLTAYP